MFRFRVKSEVEEKEMKMRYHTLRTVHTYFGSVKKIAVSDASSKLPIRVPTALSYFLV